MVTEQAPDTGQERMNWFRRVRRTAYRAYFGHMPLGNIVERAWYLSKAEMFYDGYRKGFEAGVEAGMKSAAEMPEPPRDGEQLVDQAGSTVATVPVEFDPDDAWGVGSAPPDVWADDQAYGDWVAAGVAARAASGVEARGGSRAGGGAEDADSQELNRAPGPVPARRPSNTATRADQ